MQVFFIIHHYNLNLLSTSYIQITMAMNNDNGGYNVESHRLSKFNSEGKLVKTVGGKGGRTGQFEDIELSKNNKLFVCDKKNHRIQVWHLSEIHQLFWLIRKW